MGPNSDRAAPLPALVLAAGHGRRFRAAGGTGAKVLAQLDGRPLLGHAIDAAEAAGLEPIVVVVGQDVAASPALNALIGECPSVNVVVNSRAVEGLGTSLAAGLQHLAEIPGAGACVVLLGDQPRISVRSITDAVAAWRRTGEPVRTRYEDGPGHPVVLPAAMWSMLMKRRSSGASGVLNGPDVVEILDDAPAPRDVDVPDDLTSLLATRDPSPTPKPPMD